MEVPPATRNVGCRHLTVVHKTIFPVNIMHIRFSSASSRLIFGLAVRRYPRLNQQEPY